MNGFQKVRQRLICFQAVYRSAAQSLKVALCIQRCHAACCCGGDRLAVDLILNVAGSENALHRSCGGGGMTCAAGNDVAL